MEAKLEKIWMGETADGRKTIRIDWSNDRHHEVVIRGFANVDNAKEALLSMASLIGRDRNLRE